MSLMISDASEHSCGCFAGIIFTGDCFGLMLSAGGVNSFDLRTPTAPIPGTTPRPLRRKGLASGVTAAGAERRLTAAGLLFKCSVLETLREVASRALEGSRLSVGRLFRNPMLWRFLSSLITAAARRTGRMLLASKGAVDARTKG